MTYSILSSSPFHEKGETLSSLLQRGGSRGEYAIPEAGRVELGLSSILPHLGVQRAGVGPACIEPCSPASFFYSTSKPRTGAQGRDTPRWSHVYLATLAERGLAAFSRSHSQSGPAGNATIVTASLREDAGPSSPLTFTTPSGVINQ